MVRKPFETPEVLRLKHSIFKGGPADGAEIHRAEFDDRYRLSEVTGDVVTIHSYRFSGVNAEGYLVYAYVGPQIAETFKP